MDVQCAPMDPGDAARGFAGRLAEAGLPCFASAARDVELDLLKVTWAHGVTLYMDLTREGFLEPIDAYGRAVILGLRPCCDECAELDVTGNRGSEHVCTSIFAAVDQGQPLGRPLPDRVSVSVVTLAELELGVLVARDPDTRAQRLATQTRVREEIAGLPADERVASAYARPAAGELAAGRTPRVHDTWIAATALVHGAEVWAQDRDFSSFAAVDVVRV